MSYLFEFWMQTQSAIKVVHPALLTEQSPWQWVSQEIVYMRWYSLWADLSSGCLMPFWFVRAKSQCNDCVVLGFFPVPGVCEKWSAHTARFQKNNQTAPALCKQEPQKGWKKYLNGASNKHLWSGPDSVSSNLSDGFRRWCVAKAAAFGWWLSYCSGELRRERV